MKSIKYTGKLSDDQWDKVAYILSRTTRLDLTQHEYRAFVEAVLWVILNRKAWADIPPHFGNPKSIYTRFYRWNENALWHLLARRSTHDQELHQMLAQINDRCDFLNRRREFRSQDRIDSRKKNSATLANHQNGVIAHQESTSDPSH